MKDFRVLIKRLYEDIKISLESYFKDEKNLAPTLTLLVAPTVLYSLHFNEWAPLAHFSRGYLTQSILYSYNFYGSLRKKF